jgi:hypothetical protein
VPDDVDVDALDAPDEADVLAAGRRKSCPSSPDRPTAGCP